MIRSSSSAACARLPPSLGARGDGRDRRAAARPVSGDERRLRRDHRPAHRSGHRTDHRRSLWLLFGSVGFVLLIACANVANLVLARSARRRTEFSLRTALGASRVAAGPPGLTENLVLSLLGGAVGAAVRMGAAPWRSDALGRRCVAARGDDLQLDATRAAVPAGRGTRQRTARWVCCRRCSSRSAGRLTCSGKMARARSADAAGAGCIRDWSLPRSRLPSCCSRVRACSSAASSASRRPTRDSIRRTCCCCRSICQGPTTTREGRHVLHRGAAADSRPARGYRRRRRQRLLHPPTA